MSPRVLVAALAAFATSLAAQPDAPPGAPVVRYDGHRIVRVTLKTPGDLGAMERLGAAFWGCEPRPGPAEFRVPPEAMAALEASAIPYVVVVEDLQARLDAENARLRAGGQGGVAGAGWFDDFRNRQAISEYVDTLVALRPDLASRVVVGQSIEGRDIFGLRIANDAFDTGRCKPAVLLNSVQHAREWITPMVNMYNADRLIRDYGTDPAVTDAVDRAEVWIIPIANPDGYVYTWTTDRFWRKNRRDNGDGTFGVDNNRNWGYQWGLDLPGGASGSPDTASDVYWGAAPFSEPENRALRDWALARPGLRASNDIHSAAQMILQPWGWTDSPPPDQDSFDALGHEMSVLINAVHGKTFAHGSIYTTIYPVSGGAVDWFYGDRGAIALSYELRGPGFDPPPDRIILGAEETWPATLHQVQAAIDRYPFRADWNADCEYNLFDFLAFVNDFNAGDPKADFNGDGALDLFDFLDFVNAFNQGL